MPALTNDGLKQRAAFRYQLLDKIFDELGGSTRGALDFQGLLQEADSDRESVIDAILFLSSEKLVYNDSNVRISLTHVGIVEVERARGITPGIPSHFTPEVIHIFNTWIQNSSVGVVQVDGTGNRAAAKWRSEGVMSLEGVRKRDAQRLKVLRALYDEADGSGATMVELKCDMLGLTVDEYRAAATYLEGEGLVEFGLPDHYPVLRLLNPGINEVESTIRNPEKHTNHFEPVVINIVNNYFDHSTVGSVQIEGTGNSAEVTQADSKRRMYG